MNIWLQDLRLAFRMLGKNVVMTLIILASLGIGIGANSAIFSAVDALLLRPLPYPHPDRLAAVWLHSPESEFCVIGLLRASTSTFRTRTIRSTRWPLRRAAHSP